jgi:hypothetical protein
MEAPPLASTTRIAATPSSVEESGSLPVRVLK